MSSENTFDREKLLKTSEYSVSFFLACSALERSLQRHLYCWAFALGKVHINRTDDISRFLPVTASFYERMKKMSLHDSTQNFMLFHVVDRKKLNILCGTKYRRHDRHLQTVRSLYAHRLYAFNNEFATRQLSTRFFRCHHHGQNATVVMVKVH